MLSKWKEEEKEIKKTDVANYKLLPSYNHKFFTIILKGLIILQHPFLFKNFIEFLLL